MDAKQFNINGSNVLLKDEAARNRLAAVEGKIPSDASSENKLITKTVNDLLNYYLKSETYTKAEVEALIGAIQHFHYEVYASTSAVTNPASNVLYLIGPTGSGADKYEEYVYSNNTWVKIGDTSIDLSGYVTTEALNTALAAYTTTANLTTLLSGKQDVISDLATIRSGAAAGATAYQKPGTGIPKTDLASGVQDSLDLADESLQYTLSGQVDPSVTPGSYVTRSDIVDNLTTDDATKILSAKQGKVLGDAVSQLGQEKIDKKPSRNLFDKNDKDVLIGEYISASGSTGTGNYVASGFIPVKANTEYYCAIQAENAFRFVCFYDAGRNVIANSLSFPVRSFITPVNCAFVRVTFYNNSYQYAQVSDAYIDFREYNPTEEYLKISESEISDLQNEVGKTLLSFVDGAYIKSNYSEGAAVDIKGTINSTYSCLTSKVSPGMIVGIQGTGGDTPRLYAFVDANGNLVSSSAADLTMNGEIIVPNNAALLICNAVTAQPHKVYVSKTDSLTELIKAQKIEIEAIKPLGDAFAFSVGIFNPDADDNAPGKYLAIYDASLESGNYNTTGFMAVSPGHIYKAFNSESALTLRFICFYAEDKTYLGQSSALQNVSQFTVPSNAKFARASFTNSVGFSAVSISGGDSPCPFGTFAVLPSARMTGGADSLVNKEYVDLVSGAVDSLLGGKKIVACGDSYTQGDYTGEQDLSAHKFQDGRYAGSNKVWPFYIGQRTGAVIHNLAVSGSRMATTPAWIPSYWPDGCFSYQLYQQIDSDADYIVIYYGINDAAGIASGDITLGTIDSQDTTTFFGAWNTVLSWIVANRPSAKIGIIVTNNCSNQSIIDAEIAIANKYGVPYLNLANDKRVAYFYRQPLLADVVSAVKTARDAYYKMNANNSHPNDLCQEYVSKIIEAFIRSL